MEPGRIGQRHSHVLRLVSTSGPPNAHQAHGSNLQLRGRSCVSIFNGRLRSCSLLPRDEDLLQWYMQDTSDKRRASGRPGSWVVLVRERHVDTWLQVMGAADWVSHQRPTGTQVWGVQSLPAPPPSHEDTLTSDDGLEGARSPACDSAHHKIRGGMQRHIHLRFVAPCGKLNELRAPHRPQRRVCVRRLERGNLDVRGEKH